MDTFHGLDFAAIVVIAGCAFAIHRRLKDRGAIAYQLFILDFTPHLLLIAISVSGLMVTASSLWFEGYMYSFIGLLHQATVIMTLFYLPFGKLFHIVQRPASIGVELYQSRSMASSAVGSRFSFIIFFIACEEGILDRNPMQYVRALPEPPRRLLNSCRTLSRVRFVLHECSLLEARQQHSSLDEGARSVRRRQGCRILLTERLPSIGVPFLIATDARLDILGRGNQNSRQSS